jgi:hypothetical protein
MNASLTPQACSSGLQMQTAWLQRCKFSNTRQCTIILVFADALLVRCFVIMQRLIVTNGLGIQVFATSRQHELIAYVTKVCTYGHAFAVSSVQSMS